MAQELTYGEIVLSYAMSLAEKVKKDVAILWNPNSGAIMGIGVPGEASHETAIISVVMRSTAESKAKEFRIAASYKPTETCIGMAWRCDVGEIAYPDKGKVYRLNAIKPEAGGWKTVVGLNAKDEKLDGVEFNKVLIDAKGELTKSAEDIKAFAGEVVVLMGRHKAKPPKLLQDLLTVSGKPVSGRVSFPDLRKLLTGAVTGIYPTGAFKGGQMIPDMYYARLVYVLVCRAWLEKVERAGIGSRAYGNNIGCILTDKDNKIIAWGLNFKSKNPNYHAETWMLQEYLMAKGIEKLPPGCTLYTSLESCYMCSGFFCDIAPQGRCIYLHEDPQVPHSAMKRKVNGCGQIDFEDFIKKLPEELQDMGGLKTLQDLEKTDTISFLFGQKSKEKYGQETKAENRHRMMLQDIVEAASSKGLIKDEDKQAGPWWLRQEIKMFLAKLKELNVAKVAD